MTQNTKANTPFPMPWSVKGVSAAARQAAKQAAADIGMTMGNWLSQAIKQAAGDPLLFAQFTDAPPTASPTDKIPQAANAASPLVPSAADAAVLNYLQKMDQKLSDLTGRLQNLEQPGADAPVAGDYDPLGDVSGENWPTQ